MGRRKRAAARGSEAEEGSITFETIEAEGLEQWLAILREELGAKPAKHG